MSDKRKEYADLVWGRSPLGPPSASGVCPVDKHAAGLYQKFTVSRTDGSDRPGGKHEGCRHFVLDLDHDPHALAALTAYASSCQREYPVLATDLRNVITDMLTRAHEEEIKAFLDNAVVVIGLEAQGHVPTIEKLLAEERDWDHIGMVIGWDPDTARRHWEARKQ